MKYSGINKFWFRNQYGNECNHLKHAIQQSILGLKSNTTVESLDNLSQYLDIMEAFDKSDSEMPDMIKYILVLKEKVFNYFLETHSNKLVGFTKNFTVFYEGLFAKYDLLKIDNKNKVIDFYVIKPKIYQGSLILKTGMKKFIKVIKKYNKNLYEEIHSMFFYYNEGRYYICGKKIRNVKPSWIFNANVGTNEKSFSKLLHPSLAKNKNWSLDLIYHMLVLIKKYPQYRINMYVPMIKKELAPYEFKTLEFIFDPEDAWSKVIKQIWNDMLDESTEWFNKPIQKFTLPNWYAYFPANKKCIICNFKKEKAKIYRTYNKTLVKKILSNYPKKLAMIDFETINDPLPKMNFYYPYDKIVVQLSMHLLVDGKIIEHKKYIVKDLSKLELSKIYDLLVNAIKEDYRLVAYNCSFENSAIRTMERILERDDISKKYLLEGKKKIKYQKMLQEKEDKFTTLDLIDFFKKYSRYPVMYQKPIALQRFCGLTSIKKTIELCVGNNNPYKNLKINNGFKAMFELYDIFVNKNTKNYDYKIKELYKYCKQDTLTMVEIYSKIREINKNTNASFDWILDFFEKKDIIFREQKPINDIEKLSVR